MLLIFTSSPIAPAAVYVPLQEETQYNRRKLSDVQKIGIPEELGSVVFQSSGTHTTSPWIFYIQDAHAVTEAQIHIQKIIEYLQKKYAVPLVMLEGGTGTLDPTLFRTFPDIRAKKKVMLEYLKRGEITGAEMAAAVNARPALYKGAEDWGLYEESYLDYFRALHQREKFQNFLKRERKNLQSQARGEKEKIKLHDRLHFLGKFSKLEVSKKELLRYFYDEDGVSFENRLRPKKIIQGIPPEFLAAGIHFYELAIKRDQTIFNNVDNALRQYQMKSAIVVAGDFHTQGLRFLFQKKGFSYALIVPKARSLKGREHYETVMTGHVSWRSQLTGTFFDAFIKDAARSLYTFAGPAEAGRQFKIWREELTRDLSRQNRLSEASVYTQYMDAFLKTEMDENAQKQRLRQAVEKTIRDYQQKTVQQLWGHFEIQLKQFASDYKKLKNQKRVTRLEVDELMRRAAQRPISALTLPVTKMNPDWAPPTSLVYWAVKKGRITPDELDFFRPSVKLPQEADFFKEEFLRFLNANPSQDSAGADYNRLGTAGKKIRQTLQPLLNAFRDYDYASSQEMWTAVMDQFWLQRNQLEEQLKENEAVNAAIFKWVERNMAGRLQSGGIQQFPLPLGGVGQPPEASLAAGGGEGEKTAFKFFMPPPEAILTNYPSTRGNASRKKDFLNRRFIALQVRLLGIDDLSFVNKMDLEILGKEIFRDIASLVQTERLADAIDQTVKENRQLGLDEQTLKAARLFLKNRSFLETIFGEINFEMQKDIVLDAQLVWAIAGQRGRDLAVVRQSLLQEFQNATVLYSPQIPEKAVHDFVRVQWTRLKAISYNEPQPLLRFAVESENAAQEFQMDAEVVQQLANLSFTPREIFLLLKLYVMPGILKETLQTSAVGLPVFTTHSLRAGLRQLAAIQSQTLSAAAA